MGLNEVGARGDPPTDARQEFVKGELRNAFGLLLTNGGIITHQGDILAYRYEDLQEVAVLSDEQLSTLISIRTLRLSASDTRPLLPEGRNVRQTTSHIVMPNTNKRLGYKEGSNGGIRLFIRGTDKNGEPHDYGIGSNWQLARAFANYATKILKHEGFYEEAKPVQRYTDQLIRAIAREEGIGTKAIPPRRHKLPDTKPRFRGSSA